ncbi:P-loop containing nucleoside triphosphate hydrolase protein [Serendipita vermifera]|nr:P-loop containing nucleoside triphosphate hydrolase protein [Serendipita vermifera]
MSWFSSIISWFTSIFFSKSAEIAIIGLQGSGKTSFVNVLELPGGWTEEVVPTVAFSYRQVRRDNIRLKIWDVAGQPRYRNLWERYCKGSDAIVFVVDSHDTAHFEDARFELHNLLGEKALVGIPLLVLANKNDLAGHASVEDMISVLSLDTITNRPVSCYSCSMKSQHNLDVVIKWLSKRAS